MSKVALFAGPSLPYSFTLSENIDIFPPIKSGDIYAIINRNYYLIAILDGLFHGVPSIWHREILSALDEGIEVWGASSMGALRACELEEYGMKGFGNVFTWYSDCLLDGDDEVALHHLAEAPYSPLTIPLVDIRYCLGTFLDLDIGSDYHELIIRAARQVPYWERTATSLYTQLLKFNIRPEVASNLINKITSTTSVKQLDALKLIEEISNSKPPSTKKTYVTPTSTRNYVSATDLYCWISLEIRANHYSGIGIIDLQKTLTMGEVFFQQSSNVHGFISFWIEECADVTFKANVAQLSQHSLQQLFNTLEAGHQSPTSFLTKNEISHFYYLSSCFNELRHLNKNYLDENLIHLASSHVSFISEHSQLQPAFPPALFLDKSTNSSLSALALEIFLCEHFFNFYRLDLRHLTNLYNTVSGGKQISSLPQALQIYLVIRFFGISALGASDSVKISHYMKYVNFYNIVEIQNV